MKDMRKKIFEIIEPCQDNNKLSKIYDVTLIIAVIASLIPLAFKATNDFFIYLDRITAAIFVIDYLLRLITADLKLNKSFKSFFLYPLTPMAIIDLLSIIPSISIAGFGFRFLKVLRIIRALRVLRFFKFFRYSKSFEALLNVFKKQKHVLSAVGTIAFAYVVISALLIYNVEPETFNTFFDAIYWAVVSLTTVGYGDIYPISTIGKIFTMISSVFGIAIIALPSGVITAGYIDELNNDKKDSEADSENKSE